ncbi:MAG: S8 family peptidase [Coraliomargaritaceae bacterium]
MKSKPIYRLFLFALVVLFGLYLGRQLAVPSTDNDEKEELTVNNSLPKPNISPPGSSEQEEAGETFPFRFPDGAIEDEVLIRFKDRQAYFNFLSGLQQSGLKPLGQIDALSVLRLDLSSLSRLKIPLDAVEVGFNFRIARPTPPLKALPTGALNVTPYNQTAAQIAENLESDGSGVLVAVLDSGLYAHKTFEGSTIEELVLTGKHLDGVGAEHGTAVASIIGGKNGIAPGASLLVVRVLGEDGYGHSFHAAQGIIHAVDKGAQIINMSLGLYQESALLRHAVEYAHGKGVLLVASAGNDSYTRLAYPAAYPEVLSVTAIDAQNVQAGFSNQSKSIDFAAPGVGILTAAEEGKTQLFSGTSAATPFVTGTLASLLSRDQPQSADQVVAELKQSLNESGALGPDPVYGGGWVDWTRLNDTGESPLSDIAVADIHLSVNALPGTNVPVEIIVQNRGNQWLSGGELSIQIVDGSELQTIPLRSTRPGEAFSNKIFAQVPPSQMDKKLRIIAWVKTEESVEDGVPDNNIRAIEVQPLP